MLAVLMLSGCASSFDPYDRFDVPYARSTALRWVPVDDADKFCRSKMPDGAYPPYPLTEIKACAMYTKGACTIYTNRTASYFEMGHELRHCFDGQYH